MNKNYLSIISNSSFDTQLLESVGNWKWQNFKEAVNQVESYHANFILARKKYVC